jgi:hypothetical protein
MVTCLGQAADKDFIYVPFGGAGGGQLRPFCPDLVEGMETEAVSELLMTLSMLTNVGQMTFRNLPKELLFWSGSEVLLLPLLFLDMFPGTLLPPFNELPPHQQLCMGLGAAVGEHLG